MKKLLFNIFTVFVLFFAGIAATGCSENDPVPQPQPQVTYAVYTGGYTVNRYGYYQACYWIGEKGYALPLSETHHSYCNGVDFYDGILYAAGTYYTDVDIKGFICSDGEVHTLPVPANTFATDCLSMVLSDGVIHTAGSHYSYSEIWTACRWTGYDTRVDLPKPAGVYHTQAFELAVAKGKVYVAGCYYTESEKVACLWANDVVIPLPVPEGCDVSVCSDIAVSRYGLVYASGSYIVDGREYACLWSLDGNPAVPRRIDYPSPKGTDATRFNAIVVDGLNMYTGGTGGTFSPYEWTPYLWENGVRRALDIGAANNEGVVHEMDFAGGTVYSCGYTANPSNWMEPCIWIGDTLLPLEVRENTYGGCCESIRVIAD